MNSQIKEFDINTWADEMMQIFERTTLTEADFKNKVVAMSNAGKYQPIYDEFILETKEVLPKIKAKGWYREFEKKNKKGNFK